MDIVDRIADYLLEDHIELMNQNREMRMEEWYNSWVLIGEDPVGVTKRYLFTRPADTDLTSMMDALAAEYRLTNYIIMRPWLVVRAGQVMELNNVD